MQNLTVNNLSNADELYNMFVEYDRADNFTREQVQTMYDYLVDNCPEAPLDIIGLCCEFSGFDSIEDACREYGYETARGLENRCLVLTCPSGAVLVGE